MFRLFHSGSVGSVRSEEKKRRMGSYEEMFKIDPTPGLIKVTEENRRWRKRLMCIETFPVPEPMRDDKEKKKKGGGGGGRCPS